jgi:hypothetical protein
MISNLLCYHLKNCHVPHSFGHMKYTYLAMFPQGGGGRGGAVVKALSYKPEGRGFDS